MTKWLLVGFLVCMPACAAQTTAMVECPPEGCPSLDPLDPITAALHRVASDELQCPVKQIEFNPTAEASNDFGPWEARGCGKDTIYRMAHGGLIVRTSVIVPAIQ